MFIEDGDLLIREIGSEFHIDSSSNTKSLQRISFDTSIYNDHMFLRSGREAIGFILDQVEPSSKIALLPAYICESMLNPFLTRNYQVEFFEVDINFNPNITQVDALLKKVPDVILVVDWFGMNRNAKIVDRVKELSPKTTILADCTHDFFNDVNYFTPDYFIVSLRKWFALPDGALAATWDHKFETDAVFVKSDFVEHRHKAMKLKNEYLETGDPEIKKVFRALLFSSEKELDAERRTIKMSSESYEILKSMNIGWMKKRRRSNYNVLHAILKDTKVKSINNRFLEENECSLFYPIIVDGYRDELQSWLSADGIYCPVLWAQPEKVYEEFEEARYLSNNLLCIPCDHRYLAEDMFYIYDRIMHFFKENPNV